MEKTKRLLTTVIAGAMILASAVPVFGADTGGSDSDTEGSGTAAIIESLNYLTYAEYLEKYSSVPAGSTDIVIDGVDYDKDSTTSEVTEEKGVYGEKDSVLLIGVEGKVSWNFNVRKAGMYNIKIEYAAVTKEGRDGNPTSSTNNIERVLYINGSVPFSESRLVTMRKTWTFNYTSNEETGELRFEEDSNGNELRPDVQFVGQWESIVLSDSATYYADPFTYYFKEGENSISLEGIREDVYIRSITLTTTEDLPSYKDVQDEYASKGYTAPDVEPIYINAETPDAVSSSTITPGYDRSSAITEPQHPTAIKRNIIGGSNWSNTSDWVKYKFNVEKAGLYSIAVRYKQDSVPGVFVSRAVKIDGEYPFEEARQCSFNYNQEWQVTYLSDSEYDEFQFYLEPGEHEIEFMATVGQFGEILNNVGLIADELNEDYLSIIKLTGQYPDENRDYGFSRVMPEVILSISDCADRIDEIVEYISEMAGGKSQNTASLESASLTLREMVKSERNIAANLFIMQSHVSNLSSWCSDLESQPLTIDYIKVQPSGTELPEANAGFIDSIKYELGQFFGSFVTDYNSFDNDDSNVTSDETASIECWMSSGRDRATIIRDLTNSDFCEKYGINVSMKLVDSSALLPSILAGIGPDISLDDTQTVEYALRGAVLPLNDMEGFDEICDRFYESALIPMSLYGVTYGLPVTLDFQMMFVRNDVLASLGLEAPKTWDDFLALIPELQFNNMTVLLPGGDVKPFVYQMGGNLWDETSENLAEHGWRTTFDDNTTLVAFTKMCDMFTQYSLYAELNFESNFKRGSVPVAITSYSSYTTLTVFAPEIAGLWEMLPIPGTLQEDGTINNTEVVTVTGISMLKGVENKEATWKFMCWYTDVDFQVDLCNEMISLLGPAAKTTTANVEAMGEMPWSASEHAALIEQYKNTTGMPGYPGGYVLDRYLAMAFNNAYNNGENPSEALLEYVNAANKEITRKRTEFGMPTYPEDGSE